MAVDSNRSDMDRAKGADHRAKPTGDAAIGIDGCVSLGPEGSPGGANLDAGGVFTLAALSWKADISYLYHLITGAQRLSGENGADERPRTSVSHRACELTGMATQTKIWVDLKKRSLEFGHGFHLLALYSIGLLKICLQFSAFAQGEKRIMPRTIKNLKYYRANFSEKPSNITTVFYVPPKCVLFSK